MKNYSYSEDDIFQFKQFGSAIPFKPDKNLPSGWMSGIILGHNNSKMPKFLSPNGDYFQGRVAAIRFMKETNYNPSDIQIMINLLKTEDGYKEDKNLPGFWLRRKESSSNEEKFISPSFEKLRHKVGVIKYLNKNGFSDMEVKKAYQYLFNEISVNLKPEPLNDSPPTEREILHWKKDSDLPDGWESSDHDGNILIRNNDKDIFNSRREALQHMIEHEQSPMDIFNLWSTLHLEGWVNDEENLPSGWRRRFISLRNSFEFLSPLMEIISSIEEFSQFIKTNSDFSEIDVEKVLNWCTKNNI